MLLESLGANEETLDTKIFHFGLLGNGEEEPPAGFGSISPGFGGTSKSLAQSLCPCRRPEPHLYLGQKQMEKETEPGHSWCPQIPAASGIYSSLSPHPRQRGNLKFPLNPPVLQHLALMDTGNVLICHKWTWAAVAQSQALFQVNDCWCWRERQGDSMRWSKKPNLCGIQMLI